MDRIDGVDVASKSNIEQLKLAVDEEMKTFDELMSQYQSQGMAPNMLVLLDMYVTRLAKKVMVEDSEEWHQFHLDHHREVNEMMRNGLKEITRIKLMAGVGDMLKGGMNGSGSGSGGLHVV